jgi:microcystin-dependent protein
MDTPFIGMIVMFGLNFQPRGWAFCNGQLVSIGDNSALFALLGTTYGGDGQNTFALPDMRGRVPIHQGQGSGLSSRTIGEQSGVESVTLLATQIPAHTHNLVGITEAGSTAVPTGAMLANAGALDKEYGTPGTLTSMNAQAISSNGGSQPHANMQPYLVINYCIALEGIFPSRN